MKKEKMFKCHNCKREINIVNLICEAYQRCEIDVNGKIIHFGSQENGDITSIECAECGGKLNNIEV